MSDTAPAAPAPEAPVTPPDPVAIGARDAELTALFERDPNRYHYENNGQQANEHYELRKAQQAAEVAKKAEPAGQREATADAEAVDLGAPEAEEVEEAETEHEHEVDRL